MSYHRKSRGGILRYLFVPLLLFTIVLTSCGSQTATTASPVTVPTGYSADYSKIIEASKNEKDGLLVYSIMSEKNWKPLSEAFKQRYPWIDLQTLDLGSYEVFERYYSESAANARTADMIITTTPDGWQDFIAKGESVAYTSPEEGVLPTWAKPAPGIYAVSSDPAGFIWNKALVPNPPKSMADLARLVAAEPDKFNGKLTTYDAEKNATGFAIFWFWATKNGEEGWKTLETIGATKPALQTSGGNMVDSVISGERLIGFFNSAITVLPRFPQAEQVLGWGLIDDGLPVAVRNMSITKKASSPNSAKLLMDFILTAEGQIAFSQGDLTAYRPDVVDKAKYHLEKITSAVGEDKLVFFSFDPDLTDTTKKDAFLKRWKTAFGT